MKTRAAHLIGALTLATAMIGTAAAQTSDPGPYRRPNICLAQIADNHPAGDTVSISGNALTYVGGRSSVLHGFNFRAFINATRYAYDNPSTRAV